MADDILKEAQDAFTECQEREADNRRDFEADIRFARLEEQWPGAADGNGDYTGSAYEDRFGNDPRLTINQLAPIIRQVVNDARQNKPAITVRPQDNDADPETAEIMTGLVRNIESASDADIAYDTAVDNAVSGGFGYFRINTAYACDDNWDQDIVIQRISDPLSVYGDPYSSAADSSDWDTAFVTQMVPKKQFEREFKGAAETDWSADNMPEQWREGDQIMVAEYWKRSKVKGKIYQLFNPMTQASRVVHERDLKDQEKAEALVAEGFVQEMGSREVMSYETKMFKLSGVEELDKIDWPGKYIPIIPVYGDEVVLKGKRHLRSLIRSARDPQKMYNYWASKATAMVALAPRVPFVGPKGAFDCDENWDRVNDESIPFLEYDPAGGAAPRREQAPSMPPGMLQEMMNAAEHIKKVTGIYDASLGARSNETSGVAIRNRQMEGDTSTFHFIDNLSRAIRHGGRVLIDLIPKVYNTERVIRVLGEDGKAKAVPLKQPVPVTDKDGNPQMQQGQDPMTGQPVETPITRIYDLTLGKYDLNVEAGPSYTSRREETRAEVVEIIRAVPESAAVLGPMYLRHSDWPGASEAADKLEAMAQGQGGEGQIPPEVQQQFAQGIQRIQQLEQENAQLKQENEIKMRELDQADREVGVKEFEAMTKRMEAMKPDPQPVIRHPANNGQNYGQNAA